MKVGARYVGRETWYGPGYCGICGGEPVPRACQWWDPDDGWRFGVLCDGCFQEERDRPPKPDDYAYEVRQEQADRLTASLDVNGGDYDGVWADAG